ncbi:MAG: hypothetical protein AAGB51_08195 [Planctomycetota bacterium]
MSDYDTQSLPSGDDNSRVPEEAAGGFGAAGFGGGEFMDSAPKARISAQTVILIMIGVLGAGLLFGMRSFGLGPVDALTEVKIDYEPPQEAEELRKQVAEVIEELDRSEVPAQIPAEWIERNPFALTVSDDEDVAEARSTGPDESALAAARLRDDVDLAIEGLEIGSIVGGRVPVARVNGEMLQVGDVIDEVLTIQAIEGRVVEVRGADGRVFQVDPDGVVTEVGG